MTYEENIPPIRDLYKQRNMIHEFEKESDYLKNSFYEINHLWKDNLARINQVKYLMIAEAPLWGQEKSFIYNPKTNQTQFFYFSDLGEILDRPINNKTDFINECNQIGLLILDISPFALNSKDTSIHYNDLSGQEYLMLIQKTLPFFFERKLDLISTKSTSDISVFFRYSRVKKAFIDLIAPVLIRRKYVNSADEIQVISKRGGGIDREKFGQILKTVAYNT